MDFLNAEIAVLELVVIHEIWWNCKLFFSNLMNHIKINGHSFKFKLFCEDFSVLGQTKWMQDF